MFCRISKLSALLFVTSLWGWEMMAIPPSGTPELSTAVLANLVEGGVRTGCLSATKVKVSERMTFQVTFEDAASASREGWDSVGAGAFCNSEVKETTGSADDVEGPDLIAKVSVHARALREMEDERILSVRIEVSLQRLSPGVEEGEPKYELSTQMREMFFAESQRTYVPLLIASKEEREAFGFSELFLRVAAEMVDEERRQPYGRLLVASEVDGEVLLDGGSVGRVSAEEEIVLRNVPVGLREVLLKGSDGEEIVRVVRVLEGRINPVHLVSAQPGHEDLRLTPLSENEQGYEEFRRERDGAVVVKIPAGEFLMGNKETERTPLEHMVYVSDFLVDKMGVTWGQYKKFAADTGIPLPPREPYWGILDDHPAVYVTWEESKAYCEWVGGRLPTEAEREKAARGTDRRKYPWGDEEPDPDRSVYYRAWGYEATAAVGTHPTGMSPYGLHDMGGNVWEWCSDWYDNDYFAVSPYRNPKGPSSGRVRVLRGGSWDSRPSVTSASCRNWGHRGYREGDFGFRCVMNDP
jgi:formylglycine-generating enzyme required for sulfatase activity